MEIKISIRTPKGQASGVEKKFRPFIVGDKKKLHETWVSPADDEIIWAVNGSVREVLKVQRNLLLFDKCIRGVLDSKLMRKTFRSKLSAEDEKTLTDMLMNHTDITIIKAANAEELVEGDKTWWQSIKEKFRRKEDD